MKKKQFKRYLLLTLAVPLIWGTTLLTPKSVVHAESQITEITFQVLDPEPESPSTPTDPVKPDKPVIPVDPSKPIPPDKDPTPPGKNSDEPKGSDHKQPGGGTGQFVNNGQDTPSSIGLPIAAATVASWEKLADRANALNQAIANTLGLKQAKTIAQEANSGKETTQKDKNNRSDSKDGTSDAARSSKENGKQDKNNQTTSSASESEQADSSQEEQGINNVVHAIKKGIFVALMLILLLSIGTAIYLLIKNKKRNEEK